MRRSLERTTSVPDKHLPTNHGFDEFFGNHYHLALKKAETCYYPKDPEFRRQYGPRGVIHSSPMASSKILVQ